MSSQDDKKIEQPNQKNKDTISINDDSLNLLTNFYTEFCKLPEELKKYYPTNKEEKFDNLMMSYQLLEDLRESCELIISHLDEIMNDEQGHPTDEEDEDDDDSVQLDVPTCKYIFTKGKNKGNNCPTMCLKDSQYCKKHSSKKE